jgi:hypothetical protein
MGFIFNVRDREKQGEINNSGRTDPRKRGENGWAYERTLGNFDGADSYIVHQQDLVTSRSEGERPSEQERRKPRFPTKREAD